MFTSFSCHLPARWMRGAAAGLCTAGIVALFAANSSAWAAQPAKDVGAAKSADDEWQELKQAGGREFRGPTGKQSAEEALQNFVNDLVADADRLRQFQTKHASHAQAKEAKRLEALALVQAWHAGDESRTQRRNQLVQELRQDLELPANKRCEVAAFAENVAVAKRANLSLAARLEGYEAVATNLVAEFPDLPDAYEALVQIAKDSPDARAPQIAEKLLASERCPAWVRREAQSIVTRYALIGKNAVEPTKASIAKDNPFVRAGGSFLVVYTWSSLHEPSIARAKELSGRVPSGTKFIGVCLDERDVAPARARAQADALPGEQIYDWLGRRGEIAEALGAVDPGLIYIINSDGTLRSVSGQRDLATALAALSRS